MTQMYADIEGEALAVEEARDPNTYKLIGAAMEVHTRLGNGFLEKTYQEAFQQELLYRNIDFKREVSFDISYRDKTLSSKFVLDFLANEVVIELKALKTLTSNEESQVINYLKVTNKTVGLLLNFGTERLQYKRIVLNHDNYLRSSASSADKHTTL